MNFDQSQVSIGWHCHQSFTSKQHSFLLIFSPRIMKIWWLGPFSTENRWRVRHSRQECKQNRIIPYPLLFNSGLLWQPIFLTYGASSIPFIQSGVREPPRGRNLGGSETPTAGRFVIWDSVIDRKHLPENCADFYFDDEEETKLLLFY